MKQTRDTFNLVIGAIGALSVLYGWIFFDLSTDLTDLLKGLEPQEQYNALVRFVAIALKIFATLLIVVICSWIVRKRNGPKSYSYEKLADELLKSRNKETKIEIIGYSLGFANPIKFRLQDQPWKNLDVTIYTMEDQTIKDNFAEDKELQHRVDVISQRLGQWKNLLDQQSIKSLVEKKVEEPIPFAALVIDDERLFVSNYKWNIEKNRLRLDKIPAPKRLFFEISRVGGAYETVMAVIKTFRRHG